MTKFASLSQTCTFWCVFYSVVISIEHPHQTPDLKFCSSARPEKATMLCFSHLMKMDTMPPLAALHIKYLAFVRETFWYGRRTGNIMNNTKLAPTVQQKALDFRRFVAVSTGNWTHAFSPRCFSSVLKKKKHEKTLLVLARKAENASGIHSVLFFILFFQTLVHQCSWIQHVALRVE